MKTRFLMIFGIAILAVGTIFASNYHVEYLEPESVYAFCEQYLFSNGKKCTVI